MSSYRIMFVDDEPNILSGVRRMLHSQHDWELHFADGSEQALDKLAAQPVDVVVADMRMPGMDGGQLLARVRLLYPSTARLILSGHADRQDIIAAVGPTQQFLAKPCDGDTLVRAITRVLAVRDLVTDERLRRILGDVDALPKPPSVHEEMIEVSSRPNSTLSDVVAVIDSDLALCAEILKLVNSAFFGLSGHVDTVERAASLLGLDTIHALAVSGKVFGVGPAIPERLDLVDLRKTGMRAAAYARAVAGSERWARETVSQAFLTALMRDLGLLVLVSNNPDAFEAVDQVDPRDPWSRRQAELDAFGCTVPEASAYLLGLWGFSEPVVEAMASQPTSPSDPSATPLAHVVSYAHRRAVEGHVPLEPDADEWLSQDRQQRWNDVCDAVGDDDDDESVLE